MHAVIEAAVADARALAEAGFPALMVENFGDVPFYPDDVPPETVAAVTSAVLSVIAETDLPVGVNVLRNDALSSLGVAAATGASFVRVNVLSGVMYTDQGPIVGRAAEVARMRATVAPGVQIWADVMVKHSTPPPGLGIGQAAADTVERGLADGVIVSGTGTGAVPEIEEARAVRAVVPKDVRLIIGSGTDAENIADLASVADTFIVGSSVKRDGQAASPVDPARAQRLCQVARDLGLA